MIIFDEFHERSIHADTALAFCLEIQQALRDDLTLLIMSATLDPNALCRLLPLAHYVESQGRGFPIEYHYFPLQADQYLVPRLAEKSFHNGWIKKNSDRCWVFLPSVGDIKQLYRRSEPEEYVLFSDDIDVCPLYGQLDSQAQQMAITPSTLGRRKIGFSNQYC